MRVGYGWGYAPAMRGGVGLGGVWLGDRGSMLFYNMVWSSLGNRAAPSEAF